jgi:hypothetical protein
MPPLNLDQITDQRLQQFRTIIARTYALIHDPARHTTGVEARNARGNRVSPTSKNAATFCLFGAEQRVKQDLGAPSIPWYEDPGELFDACAVEIYSEGGTSQIRPAARANDTEGHEAALKILRCSMAKVREELKRRGA